MAICTALEQVGTGELVEGVGVSGPRGPRDEYISIFKYILSPLYLQQLGQSRANEPVSPAPHSVPSRLTHLLYQLPVGTITSLNWFRTKLGVRKDKALEMVDTLVEAGYLEQVSAVIRHNKTVTIQYRVMALPVDAGERSEPVGFESLRAEYTDSPAHDRLSQSCKEWWSGKPDDDASERAAIQDESD